MLIEGGRQPLQGDLIFSRNATVGEVAQVHADHPRFAMGQDVVLLRKLSPSDSSDYMQHVIRSPIIVLQLANMMIGSTFKRINVEEIRSFLMPSPPPSEQAEIATFLETESAKFDTLAAEAQRAIDLLQERRTALVSAAVTGQIDVRGAV
jgi:type I restriction enzyme S subunit